jgi:hypothetical protein
MQLENRLQMNGNKTERNDLVRKKAAEEEVEESFFF